MQLCIDQGNSSTKIGIFKNEELAVSKVYKSFEIVDINSLFEEYPIESCIYSTVSVCNKQLIQKLKGRVTCFIDLNHETPIPIINAYGTPQTLGNDRLAAVTGASFLKPDTDILVVDAGSAITFDFIDRNKKYHGGNISPGVDLRFRALHEFTERLPLVELQNDILFLGNDTNSAIHSGVVNGICFEIDGYIERLRSEYHELSTFLTGGNTFYFANKLKNAIFADTNLVLIGLNCILQYNV